MDLQGDLRIQLLEDAGTSTALRLAERLLDRPYVTVQGVARDLEVSYPTAQGVADDLVSLEILSEIT